MSSRPFARQVDLQCCILWGDRLRVLLNSDHISYGEINALLREKGIFVCSSDKSVTVPLLSSCLLTPTEFERLIMRCYSRESLEKYKTDKLTLSTKTANWQSDALIDFDQICAQIKPGAGCQFVVSPNAARTHSGEIEIGYSIRREDFSKDWIEQELEFSGAIRISRQGDQLLLELQKTHTSKETDQINSSIVQALTSRWKLAGSIVEDKPLSIRFEDFTNEERFRFFISLTSSGAPSFQFGELVDIEIIRDQGAGDLPNDPSINWMEGRVKRAHITGDKLHELGLFVKPVGHKHYLLVKMSANFHFQCGGTTGTCLVVFSFSSRGVQGRYARSELSASIERLPRLSKNAEATVRKSILRSICDLQDFALSDVHARRAVAIAASTGQSTVLATPQ